MSRHSAALCALLAVAAAALVAAALADSRNAITSLPGLKGSMLEKQWSGYINVDTAHDGNLFYWYFETRDGNANAPLVLWLTGGPGCSSELAMLTENGGYRVNSDLSLTPNRFAWNEHANLLFVDQPVGTGFSYSSSHLVRDEAEVAEDMYHFFQGFLKQFPELQGRDLFITGESFAGHYVPAISTRIVAGNQKNEGLHIPLVAVAIGNGWINPSLQYAAYAPFAYENGLISSRTYASLNSTAARCQSLIKDGLFVLAAPLCGSIMDKVLEEAGNINIYDIKLPCVGALCYNFTDQVAYMNQPSVLKALNVRAGSKWSTCSNAVNEYFTAKDRDSSFEPNINTLLSSAIRVLIYNGKLDLICNYVGGQGVARTLQWPGSAAFLSQPVRSWLYQGSEVGQVQEFGPLTFLAIEGAGHMVPMDQPGPALQMLSTLLAQKPFVQMSDDEVAEKLAALAHL